MDHEESSSGEKIIIPLPLLRTEIHKAVIFKEPSRGKFSILSLPHSCRKEGYNGRERENVLSQDFRPFSFLKIITSKFFKIFYILVEYDNNSKETCAFKLFFSATISKLYLYKQRETIYKDLKRQQSLIPNFSAVV